MSDSKDLSSRSLSPRSASPAQFSLWVATPLPLTRPILRYTLLGTKRWGRGGGVTRRLHPSPPTASTLRGLPLPPPPPGTGAPTSLSQD